MDTQKMRHMVAEEPTRSPVGRQVAGSTAVMPMENIEGKYGAKPDKMLRGLDD
ncbi:MAG: hypothetical protein JXB07_12720 [Anaerolineae bacterium]|nr:hypothetical protein [Anaerolineae bacterium]